MRNRTKLCSRFALMGVACLGLAAAGLDCKTDAAPAAPGGPDGGGAASPEASAPDSAPSAPSDAGPPAAGGATATFSSAAIDFGGVNCGAEGVTKAFTIAGSGPTRLAVTATTTGAGFSVSPTSLSLGDAGSGTLTISTSVPASATAGAAVTGSLNLFTNDPNHSTVSIPLTATPTGAMLALAPGVPTSIAFPTSALGAPAPPIAFGLVNLGNAGAAFSVGAPSNSAFSLATKSVEPTTVMPGQTWSFTAGFTPSSTALASATSAVTATGPVCGGGLATISFSGQGTVGQVVGWPTAPLDYGFVDCGGAPPATQSFTLQNLGPVAAKITGVSLTGAPGFATSAALGSQVPANGGSLAITVTAPAVPSPSPLTPVTGTLTILTDADSTPHVLTLTMEPRGAVLTFDTSPTQGFGNFGPVVLLGSATQAFNLKNTGNGAANVALSTPGGAADGGASPFALSDSTFALGAGGSQADSVTFAPVSANSANGSIAVATTSPLCGPLPAPVPLSGVGLGGGPVVVPASLQFPATCGGAAPPSQTFTIVNQGSSNLTWSVGPVTGPGASQYLVTPSVPPGLLTPGQSAVIIVTAAAVPSPAPSPNPAGLAASVAVTTDVPLDPPHVVSLGEIPLGDQLSLSASTLRFGQPPIGTTLSQTFVLANGANPGSPAATVSFGVQGGGAGGYSVTPATASSIAPGGGDTGAETVAFTPNYALPYPATITLSTSDALCTPLPAPMQLSGTGAQGKVYVPATSLTFGTDPNDPAGLVNCGATGLARSFTLSNVGNAPFQITALTLGLGAASPYELSGDAAVLPASLSIGGAATLTVTPKAIPAAVADPNDASAFSDTLAITTNAARDPGHSVALIMQARGAVIASTPLPTTWSFGTVSSGSIGTLTSTIKNEGNAPALVELQGLSQPGIFGIMNDPTTAVPNAVTAIVGQFVPPSANGSWADQANLVVTADAFCAPLPGQWDGPKIALLGTSNGGGALSVSGSLAFPTTSCGSPAPAAQTVTLSNATNVAYHYGLSLNAGTFYSVTDASGGVVPAGGTATIVVTPKTVTPGPGVQPGAAPYADELVVKVAGASPSSFVIPISWALSGAVLSLPEGAGPLTDGLGNAFYAADTAGSSLFPMDNTGTASATVDFAVQPLGVASFSPASPFQIIPGIRSTPALSSGASAPACPATAVGKLTFLYTGPVCQPFPFPSVAVHACVGTQ